MEHFLGIKKESSGEKVTIIFPFLPKLSILKIIPYLGRGEEMGRAPYGGLKTRPASGALGTEVLLNPALFDLVEEAFIAHVQ